MYSRSTKTTFAKITPMHMIYIYLSPPPFLMQVMQIAGVQTLHRAKPIKCFLFVFNNQLINNLYIISYVCKTPMPSYSIL